MPHLAIPSCLFDVSAKAPDEINWDTTVTRCESAMNDDSFRNNYSSVKGAYAEKQLSAESYVRYLKMYARRYGLERHMKLGCSVVKVVQSHVVTEEGDVERQCVSGEDSHSSSSSSSSSSCIHADDDSNNCYFGNARKVNSNITTSFLSSTGGKDRGRGRERDSGLGWEVHYTYSTPSGARVAAIIHCRCVVVAGGKAQLPATDPHLMESLKGYTGYTVNAKDVKDLKG